jgi:hypothetical protein
MRLKPNLSLALGTLTGMVGLVAMIRLITGAGLNSAFAWIFLLLAMVPWIIYCSWRARHGKLGPVGGLAVVALCAAGLISVWLFTLGPVLALACSLGAFVIIWVADWPPRREPSDDQYVRVEELTAEELAPEEPKNAA